MPERLWMLLLLTVVAILIAVFIKASAKIAALEATVEDLKNERIIWDHERDRLLIREKNLMQQHDECRNQLKSEDSTTNEGHNLNSSSETFRRQRVDSDLEELRKGLSQSNVKTTTQEVLLAQAKSGAFKMKVVPKTGNSGYQINPVLVKQLKTMATLNKDQFITGITIMNEDMFVVTLDSNVIERFDSTTLLAKRMLILPGHESLQHIRPCNQSQVLFVIDQQYTDNSSTCISSVDPLSEEILNSRPVDKCITRLSVTEDCHVIAACPDTNSLIEYSSTGHLIREIVLKPEMRPRLALKMINGNFLVSYYESLPEIDVGLAILNANGTVLKYFEFTQRGEVAYDMAIDRLGNILVASVFGRVLLFSSDLEYERDLVSRDSGIGMITAMYLDEVNRRLFVCDCNYNAQGQYFDNARILVFNLQ